MRAILLAAMFSLAGSAAVAQADTVVCSDGTKSQSGRGACSHHGGVAKAPTERKPAPTTSDEGATGVARCADGTLTTAKGRGACSGHGGLLDDAKPAKVTRAGTRCVDGTLSKVEGRGACSGHGGVLAGGTIPTESLGTRCADGTVSATRGRGACSRHGGGIAKPKRSPTEQSRLGEPMAKCRDGSIAYSAQRGGTCVKRGGVRDWLSS